MAKLDIKIYPNPILKQVAKPVTDFGKDLSKLLDDMVDTMYAERGIGLAAPQVGVGHRIAVVDVGEQRGTKSELIELINPEIIARQGKVPSEEGCLSIPDYRDTIERSATVTVKAFDRAGKEFQLDADEILAICFQHEIDHLDGILFIDRLSRLKREFFRRWYKKQLEQSA